MGLTIHVVRGRQASRLLMLVHGLGADERDLAGLLAHLDPEGHFLAVFPRGPYSAPPGYAWYMFGGPPHLTEGTMRSSLDALDEALEAACSDHGMRREDAVVGGFSQGASLSLALSFRRGVLGRPAGVLAMSGYLPEGIDYDWEAPSLPPVLIQHGSYDPLLPVEKARDSARTLAEHKIPVVYREYPMEHQIAIESIRDAKQWLDGIRAGERPSEEVNVPGGSADGDLVKSVSAASFESEVISSPQPVIVDFWAPWCAPCRMVDPIVRQIATMRKGSYKVVKLNIDEAPDIAQRYGVQSIPLVALFRNGRMERQSLGAKPRQQLEAELGMLVIP